jgi:hypothetical protein
MPVNKPSGKDRNEHGENAAKRLDRQSKRTRDLKRMSAGVYSSNRIALLRKSAPWTCPTRCRPWAWPSLRFLRGLENSASPRHHSTMYKGEERRRHPVWVDFRRTWTNPARHHRRGKRMPTVLCVIDTSDIS